MLNALVRIANLRRRHAAPSRDYFLLPLRTPCQRVACLVNFPSRIRVESGAVASLSLNPAQQTSFKDLTGTIMGRVELCGDRRAMDRSWTWRFPCSLQRSAHAATLSFAGAITFPGRKISSRLPWQDNTVNVKSANAAPRWRACSRTGSD